MKKLVLFICFFFITSSQSFAIDSRVENVFGDFLKKLETRYSLSQREIVLTSLRDKVSSFKNQEKYKNLISVLSDISTLNNEALYKIWLEKNLAHTDQQILEIKQRKVLKSNTINPSLPSSVSSLI